MFEIITQINALTGKQEVPDSNRALHKYLVKIYLYLKSIGHIQTSPIMRRG